MAVAYGDHIHVSTDFGVNRTARDGARTWTAIAPSSDGSKLAEGDRIGGHVHTSVNLYSTTAGPAGSLTGSQSDALMRCSTSVTIPGCH